MAVKIPIKSHNKTNKQVNTFGQTSNESVLLCSVARVTVKGLKCEENFRLRTWTIK